MKEATLIAINDGDVVDAVVEEEVCDEEPETPVVLPNNNIISEIANKLKETNISEDGGGSGGDILRDQEYVENMGFKESGASSYNSADNGSYSSSCDAPNTRDRKKRLRKRSKDVTTNSVVNGNASEIDSISGKSHNGSMNGFGRDRVSSKGSISQSDTGNGHNPSSTVFLSVQCF